MRLISKERFKALWQVIVEEATQVSAQDDSAMSIGNGVSPHLKQRLIQASRDDSKLSLASQYQVEW